LTAAEADKAFEAAGYDQYGFACWRDALTRGAIHDRERMRSLEKAGLDAAAAMLREELAATDGHGA
jgi:hypothetical protein